MIRGLVLFVVVVGAIAAFVALGLWQLERREERIQTNAEIEKQLAKAPVSYRGTEPEYRQVSLHGSYLDRTVLLRNRANEGRNGYHVLVPFRYGGAVVLVDRGWIPRGANPPPSPTSEVDIVGVVRLSQTPARFGPKDAAEGTLTEVYWVDLPRLSEALGLPLGDRYVELRSQRLASEGDPIPGENPPIDQGPHLSYALQWFSFALITLVGYLALLRRDRLRSRRSAESAALPDRV